MIIYNVTIKIDLDVHDEWLQWMQQKHIPDVLKTSYFEKHKILRILKEDESDGITYSIQYFCESLSKYFEYNRTLAPKLQKEHTEKYKNKFVAFRTLLKEIN